MTGKLKGSVINSPERKLLDAAIRSGIMKRFKMVVEKTMVGKRPRNIERFFLTIIRSLKPKRISRAFKKELRKIINVPGGTSIMLLASQGIGVIVSNGVMRIFIEMKKALKARAERPIKKESPVWIKTRHGYAIKGVFHDALKSPSIGQFAR